MKQAEIKNLWTLKAFLPHRRRQSLLRWLPLLLFIQPRVSGRVCAITTQTKRPTLPRPALIRSLALLCVHSVCTLHPCRRAMALRRLSTAFITTAIPLSLRRTLPSQQLSRPPSSFRRPRANRSFISATMVTTKSVPGALDTDPTGGVLLAPRDGTLSVDFSASLSAYEGELFVLAVWAPEDDDADFSIPESLAPLDKSGVLAEIVADSEFKAKAGSSTEIVRVVGSGAKRVVLYGLGKKSKGSAAVAGAAKFAVQKAIPVKACRSVGIYVDGASMDDVASIAEGAHVGGYVDERYKEKKETEKVPSELVIVGLEYSKECEAAVARGTAIATGIITTKEVISAPANALTPHTLALAAQCVAKEVGLDIKIMGRAECEELGMGSYLGVGRGSTDEPQFIHMTYTPEGSASKKVCMVGKAVTFDTGGTNLKVGASQIEMMKFDMGGSGVCLGAAKAIGQLKPKGIEVHFIMPAVENMLSDKAIHPGDILKASNGKTIEVLNTDAEGRLCLADALVYAEKLGEVDYIVDMATLTGACIVSLGNDVAGVWSTSDELAAALVKCGEDVGESMWRMPLYEDYAEQLKSKIADLRNIGAGRAGSSIIAALFLKEFVTTKNWAHIDMAGPVWSEKKGGATGYGVKTMVEWVESLIKKA